MPLGVATGMGMRSDDARRVLAGAAARVGGVDKLATQLDVSERLLRHYIEGHESVPDSLFLKVVDVILKQIPEPPKN
jgi:hypothetical protein